MTDKEHRHLPKLKEELAEGRITRRDFLRYSTLLGLSAAAAYKFAGDITGVSANPNSQGRNDAQRWRTSSIHAMSSNR